MSTAAIALWSEEPAPEHGLRRVRAHIGGLHCSLCTGTIEKALSRQAGVRKVSVSLTHEQTLVEFDPAAVGAAQLMGILTDIGYTLSDPRKLEPFERQERALARERSRFLAALAASLTAIGLIAHPALGWGLALSAVVVASRSLSRLRYSSIAARCRQRPVRSRWPHPVWCCSPCALTKCPDTSRRG